MSDKQKLSTQEWQLLSAYLDGQLTEKELRQAEKLLTSRPDCQAALEELKRLQILLRYLPVRRVPRNFTISTEAPARPRLPVFNLVLRVSSAVTAVLLGFALALDYLPALRPLAVGPSSDEMQAVESAAAPAAEMALKSAEEEPNIIYWGAHRQWGRTEMAGVGRRESAARRPLTSELAVVRRRCRCFPRKTSRKVRSSRSPNWRNHPPNLK